MRSSSSAYASHNPVAFYAFLLTVVAAALTSFYSWRLIFKTFFGEPHDQEHYEAAHESPLVMTIPLLSSRSARWGGLSIRGDCSPDTASRNSSANP